MAKDGYDNGNFRQLKADLVAVLSGGGSLEQIRAALYETISGGDTPLANLFVKRDSFDVSFDVGNLLWDPEQDMPVLRAMKQTIQSMQANTAYIEGYTADIVPKLEDIRGWAETTNSAVHDETGESVFTWYNNVEDERQSAASILAAGLLDPDNDYAPYLKGILYQSLTANEIRRGPNVTVQTFSDASLATATAAAQAFINSLNHHLLNMNTVYDGANWNVIVTVGMYT
jgi:hypothetical protein